MDLWEAEPDSRDLWAAFEAFSGAVHEGRIGVAPTVTLDDSEATDEDVRAFGRDLPADVDALPRDARAVHSSKTARVPVRSAAPPVRSGSASHRFDRRVA